MRRAFFAATSMAAAALILAMCICSSCAPEAVVQTSPGFALQLAHGIFIGLMLRSGSHDFGMRRSMTQFPRSCDHGPRLVHRSQKLPGPLNLVVVFPCVFTKGTCRETKPPRIFGIPVSYDSSVSTAQHVAVADVNRDGKPDVLVGHCCNLPRLAFYWETVMALFNHQHRSGWDIQVKMGTLGGTFRLRSSPFHSVLVCESGMARDRI